jgi:hypothetical protein
VHYQNLPLQCRNLSVQCQNLRICNHFFRLLLQRMAVQELNSASLIENT